MKITPKTRLPAMAATAFALGLCTAGIGYAGEGNVFSVGAQNAEHVAVGTHKPPYDRFTKEREKEKELQSVEFSALEVEKQEEIAGRHRVRKLSGHPNHSKRYGRSGQ